VSSLRFALLLLAASVAHGQEPERSLDALIEGTRAAARDDRLAAVDGIAAIGSATKRVMAALESRLSDERPVSEHAAKVLMSFGPDGVAVLRRAALEEPDRGARELGVECLDPADPASVPVLKAAAADPEPAVRARAVVRLGQTRDPQVVPDVLRALRTDPDGGVRSVAVRALGDLGVRSPDVIWVLVDELRLDDCVDETKETLATLTPVGPVVIAELVGLLAQPNNLGHSSAQALAAIGDEAVPALQAASDDPRNDVRGMALRAMAYRVSGDPPPAPDLATTLVGRVFRGLDDPEPEVRWQATLAIRTLPGRAELRPEWIVQAVPPLIAMADDRLESSEMGDRVVRHRAREVLSLLLSRLHQQGAGLPPWAIVRVCWRPASVLVVALGAWFLVAARWPRRRPEQMALRMVWRAAVSVPPSVITSFLVFEWLTYHPALCTVLPEVTVSGLLVSAPLAMAATAAFLVLLVAVWVLHRPRPYDDLAGVDATS
jgi:HEAT repeat protein